MQKFMQNLVLMLLQKEQNFDMKVRTIQIGNEDYINILDLKKWVNSDDNIVVENCIITPYYICSNRRYELYQYEFIFDQNEKSFEHYILTISGKKNIDEVDNNIMELRKVCFDNSIKTAKINIINWIDYLINSQMICKEIKDIYGEYKLSNLYVAIN